MKRFYRPTLLSLALLLALSITPAFAAQTGTVVASAVIVPAQVTELSFMTSALVKEIPVQEGEQVRGGQTLMRLHIPELEYAVVAAEEALRSAVGEENVQNHRRVKDRRNGKVFFDVVPPEVREIAHADVLKALALLDMQRATLNQTILVAPDDGTIASINVLPGEYVQEYQKVITLATLDNLQIETTDLSERDITKINVGAPVNIFIEALNADFPGKVIGVAPRANIVGGDVVFKVTIAFDQQPEEILWGMTAEVTIEE
jgi:RND family efflux transporter MFP subunit